MQHAPPVTATLLELVLALGELTGDQALTTLLAHDLVAAGDVVVSGNARAVAVH